MKLIISKQLLIAIFGGKSPGNGPRPENEWKMNDYVKRIEAVRGMMLNHGWDALVLSGSDPHSSEYVSSRYQQIKWLTGYTGEGQLVLTQDHCGIWTDSRYFILASRELPLSGSVLHKTRVPGEVTIPKWLSEYSAGRGPFVVAVDSLCHGASEVGEIIDALGDGGRVFGIPDILDSLWTDRPEIPRTPIITLGTEQVGWSRTQKLSWLRRWLRERNLDAILLTALDEIAWTLNVRGNDVDYNPVVMSYLLVTEGDATWFVRKGLPDDDDSETVDSFEELSMDGVSIRNYSEVSASLAALADGDSISSIFIDPSTLNFKLEQALADEDSLLRVVRGDSPVILRKAVKNEVEKAFMREAHLEDGIAMERFLHWLETSVQSGEPVNERDAADKLHEFRSCIEGFRGESFETISAYGANAALPHYVTPEEGSEEIFPKGLYLCDSGGQYLFGTTDITRTVPLGPCTPLEMEDYTLVLKGHIDLAKAAFPKGTAGCQIDAVARQPLWNSLRNFGHGTGHGIGFYLNVHEGPLQIRQNFNRQAILPGMITSDEPGIYREGRWGIRHENLLLAVEAGSNDFASWMRFETLTLCHFDTSAVLKELLDASEIKWLNDYNERVYRTLAPRLEPEVAGWLRLKTQKL